GPRGRGCGCRPTTRVPDRRVAAITECQDLPVQLRSVEPAWRLPPGRRPRSRDLLREFQDGPPDARSGSPASDARGGGVCSGPLADPQRGQGECAQDDAWGPAYKLGEPDRAGRKSQGDASRETYRPAGVRI